MGMTHELFDDPEDYDEDEEDLDSDLDESNNEEGSAFATCDGCGEGGLTIAVPDGEGGTIYLCTACYAEDEDDD